MGDESSLSKGFGLSFGCLSGIAVFVLGVPVLMCGGCFMLAAFAPRSPERPVEAVTESPDSTPAPAAQPTPIVAKPVTPAKPPRFTAKPGEIVGLGVASQWLVVDYDRDIDEFNKLVRANDTRGLLNMALAGRLFRVEKGVALRVIETGVLMYRVRSEDGPTIGRDGWIPPELLAAYEPLRPELTPAPTPEGGAPLSPSPPPATKPEPVPEPDPAAVAAETEKQAAARLKLAKKLLDRSKASGRAALEKVVKEFPGTEAAKEAQDLLD